MSYWEQKGKYQRLYEHLYVKLVPAEGRANTEHGELLRLAAEFYHRFRRYGTTFQLSAAYGNELLTLVERDGNASAFEIAKLIVAGQPTLAQYEEFIDWVILYVAEVASERDETSPAGITLVAITDADLHTIAKEALGRTLAAEELLEIAPDLDSAIRVFVDGYMVARLAKLGAGE